MEKIKNWLENNLSEERYKHSLGTAMTAKKMAIDFNLDANKAELAGLLHDCAKEISYQEMVNIVKFNNLQELLNIDIDELNTKKVLHAPVSAYLAKEKFQILDNEILMAIRFHTIGRIGMSNFEKIIFLADKIEPFTRTEEHFCMLRNKLELTQDLNKTLLFCSQMTIKSLIERDLPINQATINLYNYLLSLN